MKSTEASWALITGASRGLGLAFAQSLAEQGQNLILVSLPGEGLGAMAEGLGRQFRVETLAIEVDLAGGEGRNRVVEAAEKTASRLGLLVNNAGIGRNGAFGDESYAFHKSVIDLNIQSTTALTYALLPLLERSRPSRIITIASLAAFQPMPLFATYAASKAFLKSWGLALGAELAPHGIGSTVVAPGGIYTNDEVRAQVRAQGLGGYLSTQEPEVVARIALAASERGRALVIPGAFNRLLAFLGGLVPDEVKARGVYARWKKALNRAASDGFDRGPFATRTSGP